MPRDVDVPPTPWHHIPEPDTAGRRAARVVEIRASAPPPRARVDAWEPVVTRVADVEPEAVSYQWPQRIARGKVQLLAGDPGLGKTFIALDVAARTSRGSAWPDGGRAPRGHVIVMSGEDGLADTIRPRLDACHADVTRVHAFTMVKNQRGDERLVALDQDLPRVERAITQTRSTMVMIDPINAYLGRVDSYKDSEVRTVFAALKALAERTQVSVLAVMHLSKSTQRPSLYRLQGSVAYGAAARIVLGVAAHPEDEHRRLLFPVKQNICTPAPTLAYRLDDGRIAWEPDPVQDIDVEALWSTPPGERAELRRADGWLRQQLQDGPRASSELEDLAEQDGIARRTLFRAKQRLNVDAVRLNSRGGRRGRGQWQWMLPTVAAAGE